jgi:hypothetical protein
VSELCSTVIGLGAGVCVAVCEPATNSVTSAVNTASNSGHCTTHCCNLCSCTGAHTSRTTLLTAQSKLIFRIKAAAICGCMNTIAQFHNEMYSVSRRAKSSALAGKSSEKPVQVTHSQWATLGTSWGSMKGRKKGEGFTPANHSRVIHMARKRSKASNTHHRMSLGV